MPEKPFKLEIITPERLVFSGDVVSLTVPGKEGSLGIWADHTPLMVELLIGQMWLRDKDGKETMIATSGGFMEVRDNHVRILADTAERAEDIDIARAEEARKRAEERLCQQGTDIDHTRAEIALKRALTRLRVANLS